MRPAVPAAASIWARLRAKVSGVGPLGRRASQAVGWNLFQLVGQNLLRLGSNLIMTRLLVPDAFALVSVVFVLITGITLVTDIGIRQSIVREADGETTAFLRTAWVLKVVRGAGLALLLLCAALCVWLTAPFWAPQGTVYADRRLPGLIALGALVPLLIGLHSANRELAERRLSYRPLALLEVAGQVASILGMLLFALLSPTVWALMAGSLMGVLVTTAGSHLTLPGPRMRWQVDPDIAWRIWHFGKWLIGSSIFTFVGCNADKLIFGALLNITTMGLLTIAYVWITAAQTVIQQLLIKVAYPVLSEIKRNKAQDLGRSLARIQRLVDLLCVAGGTAAVLLGPLLIEALYTESYHLAGHFMALLGLSLLCLRFEVLSNLLLILGDSRGMMWLWAQRAAFLVVFLPLAYETSGLTAALTLTALHSLISVPYVLIRLRGHVARRVLVENALWLVGILLGGYGLSVMTSPL
jgi:O-antigen/teichoic acid export membrane protein